MDCAAGTAPCVLHVLAVQADYDLQSAYQATLGDQTAFADFLCFIIRKLRLAYVVSFCFTNAEYRIALVDFIVALRRTKGWRRRTLRSPSPPSSGLHLLTPGNPLRRGITAAAGLGQYSQLYSGASRLSPVPNMVLLSVFGLVSFAFHSGCWACVAHFSLLGDRLFVPAATWCFAMYIRMICADRDWIVCLDG